MQASLWAPGAADHRILVENVCLYAPLLEVVRALKARPSCPDDGHSMQLLTSICEERTIHGGRYYWSDGRILEIGVAA